ncbi:MAG: alpha/beta hydrolase [bacterium]
MGKIIKYSVYGALVLTSIFFYVKYFEPKFIYHPQGNFENLPVDYELPAEDIFFRTKDNITLNGWFFPSPVENASEFSVLYFHGNAGNISHRLPIIEFMHQLGLNVFIFDYRGYGKSEGKPSEEGLYLDGRAAYEYMKSRNIDPSKIIFYGESLGAAVAIDLAREEKCAGIISVSAFTNIRQMAKNTFNFLPFHFFISSKYDNLEKINKVKSPVLIVHGTKDEIVPYSQSGLLFEKANDPKYFHKVEGAGHNDIFNAGKGTFKKIIHLFIEKLGEEKKL